MSVIKKIALGVKYSTRIIQVLGVLFALLLIIAPLVQDANFFEGLGSTILGIVVLIFILVLELLARGADKVASDDE